LAIEPTSKTDKSNQSKNEKSTKFPVVYVRGEAKMMGATKRKYLLRDVKKRVAKLAGRDINGENQPGHKKPKSS
jgi:hypothetical protein